MIDYFDLAALNVSNIKTELDATQEESASSLRSIKYYVGVSRKPWTERGYSPSKTVKTFSSASRPMASFF